MSRPKRKAPAPSRDRPPHDPLHGYECSRCTAWEAAQKLGVTFRQFVRRHAYAYDENGDHLPFVPRKPSTD